MRKLWILTLSFMLLAGANAHAGNFKGFEDFMKERGFLNKGVLDDFHLYEQNTVHYTMRECNGNCCEGIVSGKPASIEELNGLVSVLYGFLQEAYHEAPEGFVMDRARNLSGLIFKYIDQTNPVELFFDGLNVRATREPLKAQYAAGNRPDMTVRIWIP